MFKVLGEKKALFCLLELDGQFTSYVFDCPLSLAVLVIEAKFLLVLYLFYSW